MASKFRKALKKLGRGVAKVVKYAAPIAGVALGGIGGGLIGTLGGSVAGTVGAKNKSKALKRGLLYGAGVTGAGVALGAISGAGLGASGISSVSRLFGGGAVAPGSGVTTGPTMEQAGLAGGANPGLIPGLAGLGLGQLGTAGGGAGGLASMASDYGGIVGGGERAPASMLGAAAGLADAIAPGLPGAAGEDDTIFGLPKMVVIGGAIVLVLVLSRGKRGKAA